MWFAEIGEGKGWLWTSLPSGQSSDMSMLVAHRPGHPVSEHRRNNDQCLSVWLCYMVWLGFLSLVCVETCSYVCMGVNMLVCVWSWLCVWPEITMWASSGSVYCGENLAVIDLYYNVQSIPWIVLDSFGTINSRNEVLMSWPGFIVVAGGEEDIAHGEVAGDATVQRARRWKRGGEYTRLKKGLVNKHDL